MEYWWNYQWIDDLTSPPRRPGFQYRPTKERIRAWDLSEFLSSNATVLDIGCNEALFGVCLSPFVFEYTGVDCDEMILKKAAQNFEFFKRSNCRLILASFLEAHLERYDIVLCLCCLCYLGDISKVAEKLKIVTAPNGILLLESHPRGYKGEPKKWLNPLRKALIPSFDLIQTNVISDRQYLRDLFVYRRCADKSQPSRESTEGNSSYKICD